MMSNLLSREKLCVLFQISKALVYNGYMRGSASTHCRDIKLYLLLMNFTLHFTELLHACSLPYLLCDGFATLFIACKFQFVKVLNALE